jgi:hypothetical protein
MHPYEQFIEAISALPSIKTAMVMGTVNFEENGVDSVPYQGEGGDIHTQSIRLFAKEEDDVKFGLMKHFIDKTKDAKMIFIRRMPEIVPHYPEFPSSFDVANGSWGVPDGYIGRMRLAVVK